MATTEERPLRRDAERNRLRILDAAQELFADRGLDVSLNEIAHHAGVGVGTVYRRFPDKEELITALFERKLETLVELMERALADPDPWDGLVGFLRSAVELQARNTALKDLMLTSRDRYDHACQIRTRLQPLGVELIGRAQASGQLRADFAPSDLPMIQLMVTQIADCARDVDPELWRRYLELFLQSLRVAPEPPAPLSQPALGFEDVDAVMRSAGARRR